MVCLQAYRACGLRFRDLFFPSVRKKDQIQRLKAQRVAVLFAERTATVPALPYGLLASVFCTFLAVAVAAPRGTARQQVSHTEAGPYVNDAQPRGCRCKQLGWPLRLARASSAPCIPPPSPHVALCAAWGRLRKRTSAASAGAQLHTSWTTTGCRAACSPRGCPTGGPSVRRA